MTDHADEELANDEIQDEDLFHSVLHGEIIEDYPDDKPFPSCLVHGKDKMLTPICPLCGGKVIEKEVEKIVKGGNDVAILRVKAGVCEKCGERFYMKEVHKKIEEIRSELKQKATEMYKPIGRTYTYESVIE